MSIAQVFSARGSDSPRWLLFASLALNLFFIGAAVALFVRSPAPPDRSVSTRIERLAASLPTPDANALRARFQANRGEVEGARADYEKARDDIRAVLRKEPYDTAAMREAMSKARAARQDFDRVLQAMIAQAAGEMSPLGRQKLAEWPPGPRSQVNRQ
jgi:uncharacterized membrane protein